MTEAEAKQNVQMLKEAIAAGQDVRFLYRDSKGVETQRVATPRGCKYIEHDHDFAGGGNLCLVAFCHTRQAQRVFAVHRITNLRVATAAHEAPSAPPSIQELGGFRLGERVEHPVFGLGEVVAFSAVQSGARISVDFDAHGRKVLLLSSANLQPAASGRPIDIERDPAIR